MIKQITKDLHKLCSEIENRHPGSKGNLFACEYVKERLISSGLSVTEQKFSCIDWEEEHLSLQIDNQPLFAHVSPYSLSCEVKGNFIALGTLNELKEKDITGKITVLYGDLTKEQLMPKSFVFYNPEEHQEIIKILEEKKPSAIIAITSKNPELSGALYPFPLFEDGDFDIPSVYMKDTEGEKILNNPNGIIELVIRSVRIDSNGYNIIGEKNMVSAKKIVLSAHIDTKKNTPGALDNAGSVCVLLSVADMLKDYTGKYDIEILVINGEDYFSQPGEMLYLGQNPDLSKNAILNINVDGVGLKGSKTAYCCFNSEDLILDAFSDTSKFAKIDPWYQGDHMIFAMNDVPSVSLSSENMEMLLNDLAHTPSDSIDKCDTKILFDIATCLIKLLQSLA